MRYEMRFRATSIPFQEISELLEKTKNALPTIVLLLDDLNQDLIPIPGKIENVSTDITNLISSLDRIITLLTLGPNGWIRFRDLIFRYKLLTCFRDPANYGIVADHKYGSAEDRARSKCVCSPHTNCEWDGEEDAAWRTGLAALAMVFAKDERATLSLFDSLEHCWINDRPVRHPSKNPPRNLFSRDQFFPQMAACFYAWKLGPSNEVRQRGKDLLNRFISVLKDPLLPWRFNIGPDAFLLLPSQIVFRKVANAMNLDVPVPFVLHVDAIWGKMWDKQTKEEALKRLGPIKQKVSDSLRELQVLGVVIRPPQKYRDAVGAFVEDAITIFLRGLSEIFYLIDPNVYWIQIENRLKHFVENEDYGWLIVAIADFITEVLDQIFDFINNVLLTQSLIDDLLAWFFALYVRMKALETDPHDDHLLDPFGYHLLFLETLMMYECKPNTWFLKEYTKSLAERVIRHNWLNYKWIDDASQDANIRDTLANWSPDWNKVTYMWQRDLNDQAKAIREWDQPHIGFYHLTRLDYMIMCGLLTIAIPR